MNLKTGAKIVLISALTSHTFNIQALTKNQDNYFEISKNLDIYYALFKEVNQYYVDGVQPGKMVKTSIDAMLDNLDPYTNYITEDDVSRQVDCTSCIYQKSKFV
jgi:carboxyl-terminal processing protease